MSTNIIQDKSIRTYAFIDTQNLRQSIKSLGWRLDFTRFRRYLKEKYSVEKAFLFLGYIEGNKNIYRQWEEAGYILIFKHILQVKIKNRVMIKGNVDAELVLHTMIQYPNFSQAVIVSGDGDFRCLHDYLSQQNKLFKIIVPNYRKYSRLLIPYKNQLKFLNDLQNKLENKNRSAACSTNTATFPPS